jgi:hypothetical protein
MSIHEPGKTGGARADLETLRTAINHHAKENLRYGNGRADGRPPATSACRPR